jgi:hypothetical protein
VKAWSWSPSLRYSSSFRPSLKELTVCLLLLCHLASLDFPSSAWLVPGIFLSNLVVVNDPLISLHEFVHQPLRRLCPCLCKLLDSGSDTLGSVIQNSMPEQVQGLESFLLNITRAHWRQWKTNKSSLLSQFIFKNLGLPWRHMSREPALWYRYSFRRVSTFYVLQFRIM